MTDTKGDALAVARRLESVLPSSGPQVSINWSGCPAGCGNHQAADIGLQGGKARVGNQVGEVYQIHIGGRGGRAPRAAKLLLGQVPAAEVPAIVERLALAHARGSDLLEVGPSIVGAGADVAAAQPVEAA